MKWLIVMTFLLILTDKTASPVLGLPQQATVEVMLIQGTKLSYIYLEKRMQIAVNLDSLTGVPYQVQIAVDIAESGYKDNLKLDTPQNHNNDSWITCKCNYSRKLRLEHKETNEHCFRAFDQYAQRWMQFKKYKTIEENWEDKAKIISGYSWFKPNMPFEWYAERLEGCYAESKQYSESLNWINRNYLKDMTYQILQI